MPSAWHHRANRVPPRARGCIGVPGVGGRETEQISLRERGCTVVGPGSRGRSFCFSQRARIHRMHRPPDSSPSRVWFIHAREDAPAPCLFLIQPIGVHPSTRGCAVGELDDQVSSLGASTRARMHRSSSSMSDITDRFLPPHEDAPVRRTPRVRRWKVPPRARMHRLLTSARVRES